MKSFAFFLCFLSIYMGFAQININDLNSRNLDESMKTITKLDRVEITAVCISPNSKTIAAGTNDISIYDAKTYQLITTIKAHSLSISSMLYSPDGSILASGSTDNTIKLWNPGGSLIRTISDKTGFIASIDFSRDGRKIVCAGSDYDKTGFVKVFDVNSGALIMEIKDLKFEAFDAKFSPDGRYIAGALKNKTMAVWDAGSGQTIKEITDFKGDVTSVMFTPDNKYISAASNDKSIRIWDLSTWKIYRIYLTSIGVKKMMASPDSRFLIACTPDKSVKVYRIDNGEFGWSFSGHRNIVTDIALSSDGSTFVSSSRDCMVKIWDFKKFVKDLED